MCTFVANKTKKTLLLLLVGTYNVSREKKQKEGLSNTGTCVLILKNKELVLQQSTQK